MDEAAERGKIEMLGVIEKLNEAIEGKSSRCLQIVEAVGELDEEHVGVPRIGFDQLTEVALLPTGIRAPACPLLPREGKDDIGDLPAECRCDPLRIGSAVLDGVMQEGGDVRLPRECVACREEDLHHGHGVREVRAPIESLLTQMRLPREGDGFPVGEEETHGQGGGRTLKGLYRVEVIREERAGAGP